MGKKVKKEQKQPQKIDPLRNLFREELNSFPLALEAEFDRIADMYDETRRALDKQTLQGIMETLAKYQCNSILEIGVGTGRVASPLLESGYKITGMDISIRMMQKAKEKGVQNLILADGNVIPFQEKSFDATLLAHVFHLLSDPLSVMKEGARISKIGVFALVRKRNEGEQRRWFLSPGPGTNEEDTRKVFEERRVLIKRIVEKYGIKWDPLSRLRNWEKEYEILDEIPPDDLKGVSDVVVTDNFEERIARFEKGAYSSSSRFPEEMRKEIVSELRAFASAHPERVSKEPRHQVYLLAMWKSENLERRI